MPATIRRIMFVLFKGIDPHPVDYGAGPRDSRKIHPSVPPAPDHLSQSEATAWRFGYEDYLCYRDLSENRYAEWRYRNNKKPSDAVCNLRIAWGRGWRTARSDANETPMIPPSEGGEIR